MEDFKKKNAADMNDKEIVFSQSIKAGKRIYYLDVKKNRKDEMFLAITESKKIVMGEGDDSHARRVLHAGARAVHGQRRARRSRLRHG